MDWSVNWQSILFSKILGEYLEFFQARDVRRQIRVAHNGVHVWRESCAGPVVVDEENAVISKDFCFYHDGLYIYFLFTFSLYFFIFYIHSVFIFLIFNLFVFAQCTCSHSVGLQV